MEEAPYLVILVIASTALNQGLRVSKNRESSSTWRMARGLVVLSVIRRGSGDDVDG